MTVKIKSLPHNLMQKFSAPTRNIFPLPGLGSLESRVLRHIVHWAKEYEIEKAKYDGTGRPPHPPTTEYCTDFFQMPHVDLLRLLNRLESNGLITKSRRQSAGWLGRGFDGALFSSVLPTPKASELVVRYGS